MKARRSLPSWSGWAAAGLLLAAALFAGLERTPPAWWDEGWTLSVARNWVALGHFGRLLYGEPVDPGLSAGFPVVVPVALSFHLLGVGLWQGRLPGALFTLGALALLAGLAWVMDGRRAAGGTLFAALLLPAAEQMHPVLVGRQVLGELPTLFYLLCGYVFLYLGLKRRAWWLILAALTWGVALRAKAQTPPFWLTSLLLPLVAALWKRWWREALLLALVVAGSRLADRWLIAGIQSAVLAGHSRAGAALPDLFQVTALVTSLAVRLKAVQVALGLGLFTALGLAWGAWGAWQELRSGADGPGRARLLLRLALLGLAGSWYAWFVLLGQAWDRYLFPAVFLAAPFSAALLEKLTCGYSLCRAWGAVRRGLVPGSGRRDLLGAVLRLGGLAWLGVLLLLNGVVVLKYYLPLAPRSPQAVAEYLNTSLAPGTRIESYESELFFLLDRPYHFPPDQVHVELVRRGLIEANAPVNYDPLAADPQVLVSGPFDQEWHLYDETLAAQRFRLLASFPGYRVYERQR